MILDNVEFKDEYDRTVTPDSRVSCNQIRTKTSTFQAIKKRWHKFLASRLNKRLEEKKNDLVTASFGSGSNGVSDRAVKAIDRKTTAIARLEYAIARLENDIRILSKDDVPAVYVKHRAIKLRQKMMDNLTFNCASGYSVGIENYDKIFGPDVASTPVPDFEIPQAETGLASTGDGSIDVEKISAVNQQNISSKVNEAMAAETPLDRDTIQTVLNDSFANVSSPVVSTETPAVSTSPVQAEEAVASVVVNPTDTVPTSETPIDRDTIEESVEESFANLSIPKVTSAEETPVEITPQSESPIDRDTIQDVLNHSMDEVTLAQNITAPEQEVPGENVEVQNGTPASVPVADMPSVETPVAETPVENTPVAAPVDSSPSVVTVSPEEVQQTVSAPSASPIDYSGLEKAVATAVNGVTVRSVDSTNDFAEEMKKRKEMYNYVPMTDEEIQESREKLEMDKYEKIYAEQWAAIKNNSDLAPKIGSWSAIRDHITDESISSQWRAIGDYYRQIGLGEAWDIVRNRVTNSSVNSRWDSKAHTEDAPVEEMCEHYFGAVPVEWDVVKKRLQDEEILNHFDEIREYYIGIGLGEQWDTFFDRLMKLDNEQQLSEEFISEDNSTELEETTLSKEDVSTPVQEVVEEETEDNPVREPIIVVPEREKNVVKEEIHEEQPQAVVPEEDTNVPEEEEPELHFDYSEATKKDVVLASNYENSRIGLDALRARVKELEKELKKSEEELKDARDEQTDVAREAMEVREANRARQRLFAGRLQDYCNRLEEKAKVNRSSAAISRNDTACNRRFIESQTAEMRDYDDQIREIESFLSEDSEETKKRAM